MWYRYLVVTKRAARVRVAMVQYQFRIDEETWTEWKRTVPREKSLETRIIELIEADRDGRVRDADTAGADTRSEAETPTPEEVKTPLHEPEKAVEWARENAPASRKEIVAECYDADAVDVNSDTWWRKRARPALEEAGMEFARNRGWE